MSRGKRNKKKKNSEVVVCNFCKDGGAFDAKWILCDHCEKWYHVKCQVENINDEIYDFIAMFQDLQEKYGDIAKSVSVKWNCENCNDKEEVDLKMINDKLKAIDDKIECSNNQMMKKQPEISYASVVKNEKREFFPRLLIKPKEITTKQESSNVLKNVVVKNGIKVNKTVILSDGTCKIDCWDDNNMTKIVEKIDHEKYEIVKPKMLNPRLKVLNLREDFNHLSDVEIPETIIRQNNLDHDDVNVEVIKRFPNKVGHGTTLVIEVDPLTNAHLLNEQKVFIGNQRLFVVEYIAVRRCGNCLTFSHGSRECNKGDQKRCSQCCEIGHNKATCENPYKCVNCEERNAKYKMNLSTDHDVFHKDCPSYLELVNSLKRKIKTI